VFHAPLCSSVFGLSRLGCLVLSELKWAYEIVGGVSPLQGRKQKHEKCGYTYMSMVGLKYVIIVCDGLTVWLQLLFLIP